MSVRIRGQPEPLARRTTRRLVERDEPVDVDAGRDDRQGKRAAHRSFGFASGILPCRHDVAGPPQHAGERLAAAREAARDRHLGAMHYDVVRQPQRWADEPERDSRIEDDQIRAELCTQVVDAAHHDGVRQEDGFPRAFDAERLLVVEPLGASVGAGEHGEAVGRQSPPPLPEHRLDPADLRREVVRDEEVLHGRAVDTSPSRVLAHSACSVSTLSPPWR